MTRLLVIDQEPPQATRDGGSARMVAVLRLLRDEGHAVTFASLRPWPADLVGTAERLDRLGIQLAARDGAVAGWLQAEGQGLGVVIASRLPVAEAMLPLTRYSCPSARFIYDATHVEHLAKYRLAKLTGNRPLLAAALRDRTAECDVVAAADAVVAASEEDADELRLLGTGADVHVVTAVHAAGDRTDLAAGPRAGIVFLGFLGVPENELAVRRLLDGVWPLVEAELGPTPLTVIGAGPPDWLVAAAADRPRLTVTGFVDDVDRPLREAAVLVVPLAGGAGVKSKVLHACARHLPVVATADGLRGVPAVDGVHALRGESDAELAAATVRILRDPRLGRQLARRAAALLRERFNDDVSRAALRAALDPMLEVGVVLPIFNGEAYLQEALDSIAAQTLQPRMWWPSTTARRMGARILSTSSAPSLRTDRVGQAVARDRGIHAVGGDLLAFLDQDDRWLPDKLPPARSRCSLTSRTLRSSARGAPSSSTPAPSGPLGGSRRGTRRPGAVTAAERDTLPPHGLRAPPAESPPLRSRFPKTLRGRRAPRTLGYAARSSTRFRGATDHGHNPPATRRARAAKHLAIVRESADEETGRGWLTS